jgi:hypothetical protein
VGSALSRLVHVAGVKVYGTSGLAAFSVRAWADVVTTDGGVFVV